MPTKTGTILVVDDDRLSRTLIIAGLAEEDYAIEQAENGVEALERLHTQPFDVVLLDLQMPEMDGFEALERMKAEQQLQHIPVIVVSADSETESAVRCLEMGATDHLPKPFDPVLLRARVRTSLAAKQARDQEIAYLQAVSRLTEAAAAVENEIYDLSHLADVAARADELGQLARVFQHMAGEVYTRQQRLQQQVDELRIELDEARQKSQVAEITETAYFRDLDAVKMESDDTKIVAIHSFRGGTGKSNITANVATLLAAAGRRVGVIDTDIQCPGIHTLFGLAGDEFGHTLNDFLWGKCDIRQAIHDVTPDQGLDSQGQILLIPSSIKPGAIARVVRQGYDAQVLTEGFHKLAEELALDFLLIDTHPGLNTETLLSLALAHRLILILRPDQQDYEGTGVAVEVARKLKVEDMSLVLNKVPPIFDSATIKEKVEEVYACPVAAILPHADQMMALASRGIFVLRYPDHPMTTALKEVAATLVV